ncbi:MAG: hypothetical protein EHM87_24680 [Burkholderiales bacterium]|nr:MAG: hypothetical protein EHM87_24680 [Burkholderiales bacterium]
MATKFITIKDLAINTQYITEITSVKQVIKRNKARDISYEFIVKRDGDKEITLSFQRVEDAEKYLFELKQKLGVY